MGNCLHGRRKGKRRQDAYVQIGVVIAADVLYRGQAKGQPWQQQKDASQLQGFEAWAVSGACREEVASEGIFELYAVVRDQAGDRYLLHLEDRGMLCVGRERFESGGVAGRGLVRGRVS